MKKLFLLVVAGFALAASPVQAYSRHHRHHHRYHHHHYRHHRQYYRHETSWSFHEDYHTAYEHRYQPWGWDTYNQPWDNRRTWVSNERTGSHLERVTGGQRPHDCYGIPWCGCYMRHVKGVADTRYNLAREWTHYGHASSPQHGAVVVWPHHVGELIEHIAGDVWLVLSGNDGHRVRERPRHISNAIAVRI